MNYQKPPIATTITFQNTDMMIKVIILIINFSSNQLIILLFFQNKQSSIYPVGTIAYVIDEEALLVKVSKGWQYIAVSLLLTFLNHKHVYVG